MTDTEIETIMYRAVDTKHGIRVKTNDPDLLRKQCYRLRAAARKRNVLDFDSLSFRVSPSNPGSELLMIKSQSKEQSNEQS